MIYVTHWLISIGLINAALATLLAAAVWAAGQFWRRPALAHVLWVVVLLKLLTPPLVQVPIGWKLDLSFAGLPSPALPPAAKSCPQTIVAQTAPPAVNAPALWPEAERNGGEAALVNADMRSPTPSEPWTGEVHPTASAAIQRDAVARRSSSVSRLQASITLLASWLPALWFAGIAISLFVLLRRAWHFHRFIRRVGYVDPSLSRRVQQLARQAGLKHAPQVIAVQGAV